MLLKQYHLLVTIVKSSERTQLLLLQQLVYLFAKILVVAFQPTGNKEASKQPSNGSYDPARKLVRTILKGKHQQQHGN